ncbi:FHA domain-containing protein [Pseudomonas lalucatii]|uniref:FHA domain-containing protein n=1 Tax=Pseudomonas lalucatii TaxID=1424203 RepID=A0ABS5Q3H3_9PSED|nr:FHA domain-containing protein [Pseudomonas lalucatii]MBS7663189.1 FHA domain-containing protein [Pseudomonas lalucatii]
MLRVHFSDNRQAPIWLTDARFTIGQDSRNSLVLGDAQIAPFHAEVRQDHGYYYLSDCGSQAGTFVNDERISARYQLRANDRVRLGTLELVLLDPAQGRARAETAPRWFLQVVKGEQEGKKFHIHGSMTFGRSAKCELSFSDLALSRRHCEFFLKDDVLEVKDLASANGVLVNQQKVSTALLQPGDQLKMGSVSLLVIGPKVSLAQVEDEDATQFVRAIDLPGALKVKPAAPRAAAVNPLRAVARPGAAVQPGLSAEARARRLKGMLAPGLAVLALLLIGVAATLAARALF